MHPIIKYFLRVLCLLFFLNQYTWAQDYLFTRYFRSTITIDDPFIGDKLIYSQIRSEAPGATGGDEWTTNPQLLYAKRITQNLQASIVSSYLHIKNPNQKADNGFDNFNFGVRYNIFQTANTGSMLSLALNATLGGSGSHIVHANPANTISPEILWGQGFGMLPESLTYLKPLGMFIAIAPTVETSHLAVSSINIGAAIEYSLPFLQENMGKKYLPLFDHIMPIIEFPFTVCTHGGCDGRTTGTYNPGFILYNTWAQLGFEAIIPSNTHTGSKVGGIIQLHLYLDAIFKPIFV